MSFTPAWYAGLVTPAKPSAIGEKMTARTVFRNKLLTSKVTTRPFIAPEHKHNNHSSYGCGLLVLEEDIINVYMYTL